jgi:hypothetical protein
MKTSGPLLATMVVATSIAAALAQERPTASSEMAHKIAIAGARIFVHPASISAAAVHTARVLATYVRRTWS